MPFVSHPWLNANAIEQRAYQENIVRSALHANTLVIVPTGLGKTNIAALAAARRLERYPDGKIFFLAPTRPLVDQHRTSFERYFKLGPEFISITGKTEQPERAQLYRQGQLIFSTPQTTRNDLKVGALNLKDCTLLIIDEAHRAVGNYAYPYVAQTCMSQAQHPLILGLTASPGSYQQKIDEVRKRLYIDSIEIRSREDEDVRGYVQRIEQEIEVVELPVPLKSIKGYLDSCKAERIAKLMKWGVISYARVSKSQIIQLQQRLAEKKTGAAFGAISLLAEVLKVDHALYLLETQCLHALQNYFNKVANDGTRAVARLHKDQQFLSAVRLTNELVDEGTEHPKIAKLKSIVAAELARNKYARIILFVQLRDTIELLQKELSSIENAAPVSFIGQAKKKGKGMSQKEQAQILNEFRLGFYNILCASQVGEEGLDIEETNLVIFYEPVPSAIRRVQRMGRTARTKPGKVVLLMTKDTRDEAYHWSGYQKEKTMKKLLSTMQRGQKSVSGFR